MTKLEQVIRELDRKIDQALALDLIDLASEYASRKKWLVTVRKRRK